MNIETTTEAGELPTQFGTKPGTPMIGMYSTNQMDNFYDAIARGEVKPTGIMNLYQHLQFAERCQEHEGAAVLDVCCGRGLALPLLRRYAPRISRYIGLDISRDNLGEAREREAQLATVYGPGFAIELVECDVATAWPSLPPVDLALYTSAIEHMPFELGRASLQNTAAALKLGGTLYLSTAVTPAGQAPQHRVHVFEWSMEQMLAVLDEAGLEVTETIGILPPVENDDLAVELSHVYGEGAAAWYRDLAAKVPAALLDTVAATCVPRVATEALYVARRTR